MYINKNKINPELHLPTKIPFHVKESTVNSPAPPTPQLTWLTGLHWSKFGVEGTESNRKRRNHGVVGEVGWMKDDWVLILRKICVCFLLLWWLWWLLLYIYIFFVVVSIHFPTERDFNLNCHKQQHGVQFRFYHSVGASLWFFMLQGRILKFHFCHQLGTVQWGCIPVCSILHFYDYCRTMESLPDLFGKLWPDCRPLSLVMWFEKWNQLLKKSPYFGLVTFFSYCLPRSWVGWI